MRTILYKNPSPVKSIRIISVFSIIEILISLIVLTWDLSGDLSVVNAEKSCFPIKIREHFFMNSISGELHMFGFIFKGGIQGVYTNLRKKTSGLSERLTK